MRAYYSVPSFRDYVIIVRASYIAGLHTSDNPMDKLSTLNGILKDERETMLIELNASALPWL